MADQRLAGLSHRELYAMAHGGQPGAAATSQANLARAAQVLGNVSRTLNEPLSQLGLGWTGEAAEAARGGIGQHARWAQQAAAQVSSIAEKAGAQFTSATTVIAEMPPPPPAPAAGANLAAAEDQTANLRQRALELMQAHADECAQTRPTEVTRAPTAGTAAAMPGREAARTGGRDGVRAAPAVTGGAAGAEIAAEPGIRPTVVRTAPTGPVRGEEAQGSSVGAGTRPASAGPYRPGSSPSAHGGPGTDPVGAVRPGGERVGRAGAPVAEGTWMGTLGPGASRVQESPRAGQVGAGAVSEPYGPGRGPDPRAGRRPGERSDERSERREPRPTADRDHRGAPRPLAPRGGPLPGGPGGPGTQGAASGTAGPGTDPSSARDAAHAGVEATMMPPMVGGGMGFAEAEQAHHERLDYLLDEHDVFDDNGWVAPPVIGS